MKPTLAYTLLTIFMLAGCSKTSDPVVNVADDNERMNAAIAKAKETFPMFLKNWKTMPSDSASVKIGVPTPDGSQEHIWFEPVTITKTDFTGICANEPANVPGLNYMDRQTYPISAVSDWMILDGSKCYGGYTIRVLAEMQPENAPPMQFVDF